MRRNARMGSPPTGTRCHVVIRHGGFACHVRVAGIENARWVLEHLSDSFAFQTSALQEADLPAYCSFSVAYGSQLSRRKLENLFTAIPGVQLEPERSLEEMT